MLAKALLLPEVDSGPSAFTVSPDAPTSGREEPTEVPVGEGGSTVGAAGWGTGAGSGSATGAGSTGAETGAATGVGTGAAAISTGTH